VPLEDACETCAGTGSEGGAPPEPCPACGGSGHLARRGKRQGGFFSISSPCPDCGGTGRRPGRACAACGGSGRRAREKRIAVTIPPGVAAGSVLRLPGQGEAGYHGGPAGDMLLEIHVEGDPELERDGRDVRSAVKVPLKVAVLGGVVDVRTLRGTIALKVPAGTSSDTWLRLKGQGIEARDGGEKGDHLVRIVVTVPKDLPEKAREAIAEAL
jgi:molecular chaperone DnaJ